MKWLRSKTPNPLNATEERHVLSRAYVPEHIPSLMAVISKGQPFLIDGFLVYSGTTEQVLVKENWLTIVGYPLEEPFSSERLEQAVRQALDAFHPDVLWFIGSQIPAVLQPAIQTQSKDEYLVLNLDRAAFRPDLLRHVRKARQSLVVDRSRAFTKEHRSLSAELIRRAALPPMAAELYRSMPEFTARSESACVLSARDQKGRLSAFFVLELAADSFDTYVLGAYSRKNYSPHASDLLFYEMILLAQSRGKQTINLGLGVNEGIRRFKVKWGGRPALDYAFCECRFGSPDPRAKALSLIEMLWEGKI